MRLIGVVAVAAVPALLAWSAVDGPGWLGDGPQYLIVTLAALVSLEAAFAAVVLAFVQVSAAEPFALFTGRRPTAIAALWLVAMLFAGVGACGAAATQQGDTAWEPPDRGWLVGWALHFLVIGALLVLLWWIGARAVLIVTAPVVTGLLAFLVSPPAGWADEDADFRDDGTFADGLEDVLAYTFATALLMGLVVAVHARASTARRASPGRRAGRSAHDI